MKKIICLIVIFCEVFILTSCSVNSIDEARIEGSWVSQTKIISGIVTETTLTFDEDGEGTISTLLGLKIPMTYSLDDGMITIVANTSLLQKSFEFDYELKMDELVIITSDETVVFERVE